MSAYSWLCRRRHKHELAHALVRSDHHDDDPPLDTASEELVAETTAYSVCSSARIDPGGFSITYLASWSERTPTATIERTAALIDRLSHRIEDAVADVNLRESGAVVGNAEGSNSKRLAAAAAPGGRLG